MKESGAAYLCALCALCVDSPFAAAVRPPLLEAAKNGDKEELRALLQKGANVNVAEGDGATALHWASLP